MRISQILLTVLCFMCATFFCSVSAEAENIQTFSQYMLLTNPDSGIELQQNASSATFPPTIATINQLDMGDRACYVSLMEDAGKTSTQFADFNICSQDLVGKKVQLTYELADIPAEICFSGGFSDPCLETEKVSLIVNAKLLTTSNSKKVQDLPDGNYRYWNGFTTNSIVPDEELVEKGGVLFRFSKMGNNIAGYFSYIDGESICLQGQVNGNTVTGIAVQKGNSEFNPVANLSANNSYATFGPANFLKVRRGKKIASQTIRYDSAILNLNGLSRINAGTVLPPNHC